MVVNKKIMRNFLFINRWKAWLFCLLSATLILACTGDLDNDGAPLVGPSFGITIIPQNPQILKTGNQTFTATGGVTPYTYSISATDIGAIVPVTGVFTALAIAGTATIMAVDKTGVVGTTTVTVMPLPLVVAPGSAVITAAGDQAFTVAATASGSNLIACSISASDLGSATTIAAPTVVAANLVCTATATAVPAAGAANETFTITIVDTNNGDRASAALTLAHPTGSPGY